MMQKVSRSSKLILVLIFAVMISLVFMTGRASQRRLSKNPEASAKSKILKHKILFIPNQRHQESRAKK